MRSSFFFAALKSTSTRFDEFFASGMEDAQSPLLTPESKNWGKHVRLKASLVAAFFLLISFILSFSEKNQSLSHLLLLGTYFLAGIPALISAIQDILEHEIKIDVLMTLSAFLSILIGNEMEGALLLVLFSFSGALEVAVKAKATEALIKLKRLAPTKGFVVKEDGSLIEQSIKDISVGTLIHIKAGQIVPLDGKVISGTSTVTLIHLTGENVPISKSMGDEVPAGARNLEGSLTLQVTQTSIDSTLAKIVRLIVQAQESKPKFQRWLDSINSRYAIVIIFLSLLFALTLPLLAGIPFLGKEGSIYRALTFLVTASPCALILAIPIAYLSSISACARQGILLKGGITLDALASCTTLALDKTGTLTKGDLICSGIEILGSLTKEKAIQVAYGLEKSAEHPIARSICRLADEKKIHPASIEKFHSTAGFGVEGFYEGKTVRMGNSDYILSSLTPIFRESIAAQLAQAHTAGEVVSLLSIGQDAALFRFKDAVRPHMAKTISTLKKKYRLNFLMLTGDHECNAKAVAQEVGISTFFFDLKPEDKLAHIAFLSKKTSLAMVGDGINDGPALARATVGISMGQAGNATAIDASDIVLLHDNIDRLDWLFDKAHATTKIVKQNVILACGVIFLATLPALFGWISLWVAVLLHEGGTVAVGLNALRLLDLFKFKKRKVDHE